MGQAWLLAAGCAVVARSCLLASVLLLLLHSWACRPPAAALSTNQTHSTAQHMAVRALCCLAHHIACCLVCSRAALSKAALSVS